MKQFQKYIAVALLTSILFPVAELSLAGLQNGLGKNLEVASVPVARAAVPTFETNPIVVGGVKVTAGATLASWTLEQWIQYVFDVLMEYFKLKILDMMVNQIVAWINGGTTGKPQFITDWRGFLGQAAKDATNIVINEVDKASGGLICTPFANQLRNLLRPIGIPGISSFQYSLSCSLDRIVQNINAFYGDFSQGGWNGYLTMVQPNNNYYGNVISILDANELLAQANQKAAQNGGISSLGFLSTQRCKTRDEFSGQCYEYENTTPGKAIGESVDRAVGNRIDYIVNSKQIVTIVAIVIDGFINKLIGAGINGLLGYGTTTVVPSGGYIPPGTNTTNCAAMPPGPQQDACLAAQQATAPDVTLSPSATAINSGESFSLIWAGINTTSCLGANFDTGGQNSGYVTLSPTVTTTYGITCTNASAQTVTKFATVVVTNPNATSTPPEPPPPTP